MAKKSNIQSTSKGSDFNAKNADFSSAKGGFTNNDYSSGKQASTSSPSKEGYGNTVNDDKSNNTEPTPYSKGTYRSNHDSITSKENSNGYINDELYNNPSVYAKDQSSGSSSKETTENSPTGKQQADMVFTAEEVYGNDSVGYDFEDSDEENMDETPETSTLAAINEDQLNRVKQQLHIPYEGFLVSTPRGRIRKNVEVERINQLFENLSQTEIVNHVQQTIDLFVNETEERSHQDRDEIDIALILAIAIRESGVTLPLSRSNNRIVTAGRDAHTRGRSGLDWIYGKKRDFPEAIRNEVLAVRGNTQVEGEFRRESVTPAYLREKDLLAAFVVEVNVRYERFLYRFHRHEFSSYSQEQRNALLHTMSNHGKRAWTQASFGSKLVNLLVAVRTLIAHSLTAGNTLENIINNDQVNLNAIITNDEIMADNLSRQRTRISAAEALLVEEGLGSLRF